MTAKRPKPDSMSRSLLIVTRLLLLLESRGVHAFSSNQQSSLVLTPSADEAPKYLRWNNLEATSSLELQTAVTTFQRGTQTVQVHAQLHLADSAYFDYFNSESFNANKAAVLYELLLDEHLLENCDQSSNIMRRRLKGRNEIAGGSGASDIQASPADQAIALHYGWTCQADRIEYSQPRWYHADLTRQEFLRSLDRQQQQQQNQKLQPAKDQPFWQLATNNNNLPLPLPRAALEAATALLVGQPIFMQQQQSGTSDASSSAIRRRLFTNLFLPGDSFATWLRYLLWIAVPSPEVSILLLDWSSSWSLSTTSVQNSGSINTNKSTMSRVSRIALPLLQALTAGRLDQVRQLVFGQVALAGHQAAVSATASDRGDTSLLIAQRNDRALFCVEHELLNVDMQNNNKQGPTTTVALLYGCNHCPDLHSKLIDTGFQAVGTEWRTAWSVKLQQPQGAADGDPGTRSLGIFFALFLPLFLVLGGTDWIGTLRDIGQAADASEPASVAGLTLFYLARHALLYVGLSKLVLDGESLNGYSDRGNDSTGLL